MVEPEEVEMLVLLPNLALGNNMQGRASFRILEKRVQMTHLCEKALFQHLVTAGNCYQIRPDGDDGWRETTLLSREYTSSRVIQKTQALAAIPAGTIVGPVIEIHVVKFLTSMDLEVSIPSICKPGDITVRCDIKRDRALCERNCGRKAEVRSSKELIEHLQESKKK